MAFSRYVRCPILDFGAQYGTSRAIEIIRTAITQGTISAGPQLIVRGYERLDTVAGANYGDGRYWWVIAAASNIGWGLQVPPGTILYIPAMNDISRLVG
jgi:hypothetical protein